MNSLGYTAYNDSFFNGLDSDSYLKFGDTDFKNNPLLNVSPTVPVEKTSDAAVQIGIGVVLLIGLISLVRSK